MERKKKPQFRIVYFDKDYDLRGERLELQTKGVKDDEFGLDIACDFVHAAEYSLESQKEANFINFSIMKQSLRLIHAFNYEYIGWFVASNVYKKES